MPTSPKKTIAILHFGGDTFRGTEACVVEAINGFHEQELDVILLANNPQVITEKLSQQPKQSLKVSYPELMWDDKLSFPLFKWISALFKLRKIIAVEKPSVILASGGLPNQLGLPIARLLGLPMVVHFHHPAPKRYFYFWMLPWADKLIVPSQHTQQVVKQKCKKDSVVVYNGIDVVNRFHPPAQKDPAYRNNLGIPADAIVVASIGALVPHKRVDIILRALKTASIKTHTPLHALIVGVGTESEKLKDLVKELQLESKVSFLSRLPEIFPYLQHVADIHISASSEEGFGLSVVEAAACGLPNIVSASGALTEVVENEADGIHVKGSAVEPFADAILRLASDKNLREKMGAYGQQKAEEKYSLAAYKNNFVNEIKKML